MKGESKAMGAISIVSAVASGRGASLAVKLPTFAKVTVVEERGGWRVVANGRRLKSPLAIHTVNNAMKILGLDPKNYSGTVLTRTSVPSGVGLKTSSSSSVAIALAVLSAFGESAYRTKEVLRCSATSSLESGVSLTGALDDAASCLMGGANFADNTAKRVLSSSRLGRPMYVLIKIPSIGSRRTKVSRKSLHTFSKVAESIFSMGMGGKIWEAMTLNGLLFSSVYGYSTTDALQAISGAALGAGLSGTGPAVAAVFDHRKGSERLANEWKEEGAKLIRTETSDDGASIG